MKKFKCAYNLIDEKYSIKDETGFVWGVGSTIEEAIENAESNLQTEPIKHLEWEEY